MNRPTRRAQGRAVLDRMTRARGGQVAVIFALLLPVLALLIAGVLDVTYALNARTQLQDASDAAALATATAAAQNPNLTKAQLEIIAQNALTANYPRTPAPTISDFHVCSPVLQDCSDGAVTLNPESVKLGDSVQTSCLFASIAPMFCVGGSTQTVNADTVTSIPVAKTLQLNIVMDSSTSMIVGATAADVTTISNWVTNNWSAVKPGDPAPYTGQDNPPCAFACHDVGNATTPADIAQGLTNAHAAGATTRWDVMISAAQQLVNHVQTESQAPTNKINNAYEFNVYSFDTALHQYGKNKGKGNGCGNGKNNNTNLTFAQALTAISCVTLGLDTYMDTTLTQLASGVGSNGTGGSANSPVKFVIIVTDGLQSDRNNNWCPQNAQAWDSQWSYTDCRQYGGYAAPLDTSICQTMKNNGIVVAVLETPYVPLTGQSPNIAPYEKTVRYTIYPGGPNTASALSNALSACATPGFYYQANNSSDIANGFITLTDQFIAETSAIRQ